MNQDSDRINPLFRPLCIGGEEDLSKVPATEELLQKWGDFEPPFDTTPAGGCMTQAVGAYFGGNFSSDKELSEIGKHLYENFDIPATPYFLEEEKMDHYRKARAAVDKKWQEILAEMEND